MASRTVTQTCGDKSAETTALQWKGLLIAGGVAAFTMLVLIIVQIVVFAMWPPPSTVAGYYSLFHESWLLGLLSLDLLYIVDSVLLILIYLGV
jgi:hypothetical protein